MKNMRINGDRLWDGIMEMAKIDALPNGGCGRLTLTEGDKIARDLFADWCAKAGCTMQIDRMGNMFARREGTDPDALPIAIGSHLDTQPHGGKFDGIYGVLAGLEIIRALNDADIQTKAPIEVINWTNEEGARFAPAMLSSGVYAGLFDLEFALARTDVDGVNLSEALDLIDYKGDIACGDHKIGAFLEAHIEQGPILEDNGETIGVVIGGQGQRWYDVTILGQDAHAGSTPMVGRKDALLVASHIIQAVHQIAHDFAPNAVGTVGEMHVSPNSRNTIPGEVMLTIDIRHPDADMLAQMDNAIRCAVTGIQKKSTGRKIMLEEIWHNPPVVFDEACVNAVDNAVNMLGYPHRRMVSGAGHDACQVARVVPTSMVFVPCAGGLSHCEEESAEKDDLTAGANVLLFAAIELAGVVD